MFVASVYFITSSDCYRIHFTRVRGDGPFGLPIGSGTVSLEMGKRVGRTRGGSFGHVLGFMFGFREEITN